MLKKILAKSLTFIFCVVLSSCSIFSSGSSTSLPLPKSAFNQEALWEVLPDTNETVYRYLASTDEDIFLTGIRECGPQHDGTITEEDRLVPSRSPSLSRKLFVGLTATRIIDRGILEIEDRQVFSSHARGDYEGIPLEFIHYMTADNDCLIDLIAWRESKDSTKQPIAIPQDEIASLLQEILG